MVRRFRLYVALLPVVVLVALHSALPSARATNTPYTKVTIQTNQGSWGNNLGDLNGDGFLDVAEGGGDLGGNVYWYSYPSWQRFLIGTDGGGDDLQIGDVNADGAPDVVVNGSGKIVWYQNPLATGGNVQGQWTKHTVDSTTQSHDIVLADLNADGRMDIIIRVELGRTYYYLQGNNADNWTKVFISQAPDGHGGLAVGDINRDGRLDIIENGFWLQAPTNYATGTWIRRDVVSWGVGSAAAAYDINHDGRLDIFLAASETGAGQLSWFEAPADPIGGTWIRHNIDNVEDVHRFFLVDVDKDGTEDLVFAEMHQSSARRVGIYHNNGLGASWSLQVLATTGSHNIAVGDIGNDGDVDIIGANWETSSPDGGAQNLWRCDLNNSVTLDAWNYIQVDGSKSDVAFGLAFGDLNNDGRPDIISGEYWYRNPGGSMTGAWARSRFGSVDAMLVTDVDGDGLLDVIAQSPSGGSVGIYWLEPTDASGSAWNSVLVGTIPASRDVTSQGYAIAQIFTGSRPQIIFSSDTGFYAFTVPANPVGGNWPRVQLNSNGAQEGIAAGDINRDGKIDVAGTSHTSSGAQGREVDWWQNPGTGSGNWTKVVVGTTVNEADRVEVADLNNDGRLDIVATDSDYDIARGNLSWFEQQAGGTWVKHSVVTNVGSLASMDVGDFNKDGLVDIVIGEHQNNSGPLLTTVLQNVGSGASWTSHLIGSGRESHEGTQAVDLDRDGDLDVVSIAYNSNQFVHLWRNDATAGASPPEDTTPPTISSVHSSSITTAGATIGWTTNEASNSQVNYGLTSAYGSSTPLDSTLVTSHSVGLSGLAASTTYHYRVNSRDAAGNLARSGDFTFTTGAASDSTPPTVAITSPSGGATVSGTVTLTVSANDNVGVAGVQYRLDGANIGAEVTSGPFSLSWNTASASNGNHSLTAIARDAAGNSTTSSAVTFTISNVAPPSGPIAFVQSAGTTADASATTIALAFPNTTTAGNVIVAAVAWGRSGALTCSDSRGNAYTTVGVEFDATRDESLGICYAANISGGPVTVTATFGAGSSIWRRMLVHEYSGLATTTPFEVTAAQIGQATTAANSVTSTAANVSTAGALIFGAVMDDAATTTIQAGSGFVARASVNGADLASEDRILGAAGSVAATWTFGAAHRYLARMVAFRPGSSDTTPPAVAISAPTGGSTVSGNVTLTAAASDNVSVAGVQFMLNGSPLGPEIMSAPYSMTWDTTSASNGSKNLAAVARDTAGNTTTSAVVAVTVNNADTTPPVITNIAAGSITTGSATISWTTNEPADGQVDVGTTTAYGTTTPLDASLVTSHSVSVSGLSASTTYHYRVRSRDGAGNIAVSTDRTFTTPAAPDTTPPVISNVASSNVTATSATVSWTTNEAADGQVDYGTTTAYGSSTTLNTTSVTAHSIGLSELSASTTYHFRVRSRDTAGNLALSTDFTVTTAAEPGGGGGGPIAYVQSAGTTADASATTMSLAFPNATTAGNLIVAAVAWGRSGALTCSDSRGNTYTTVGVEFDATRDESLGICYAANISGGAVTVTASFGAGSAIWRRMLVHEYSGLATANPLEVTAAQIGQATTAANSVTSTAATVSTAGALIFGAVMDDAATTTIQAGSGFVARASVNGADLASEDRVLGAAGSVAATWTFGAAHRYLARMVAFRPASGGGTPDTTPPVITNIAACSITTASATISWTTDEAGDSQVDIGTTTAYGTTTPLDASLVRSHSVSVSGLSASTSYHYRVRSRDGAGNIAVSTDRTFTTPAAPDTTPPVISNVASSGVTSSAATITWTTNEAADTQVDYGSQTTYGSSSSLNSAQTTSHSMTLTGLLPSTTYHYRARSRDAAGNLSLSTDFTVTTQAEPGGGGGGPIAFVQSAGTAVDASGTTLALAFPSTTTAGNLIVVAVAWGRDGGVTCSDSRGNAYATVGVQFDAQRDESLGICYAANISGGPATVTAAFNAGSAIWRRMAIHEYSGVAAVNPVAATANNMAAGSTGSNAITSTAANVSTSGSLLFAAVMDTSGETNITAGTGFTTRRSVNGVELSSEDRIASTTGSAAATWTFGAAHRYLARLVIFRSEGQ